MRSLKRSVFAIAATLFFALPILAQKQVLFTYGNDTVYNDEFTRVFLKNNQKETHSDSSIRAYLDLYINFKLKVKEATERRMDTIPSFVAELKGYRDQLAKNYMVDTAITQRLIDEAYERMKTEVKVSHIMVALSPGALPKDTLAAYEKMNALLKRIEGGESFDSVAYKESEDRSAKYNFGNLGYFSVFDMIYPFENMAYSMPIGQVSPIFRTQFGYHILKVYDKRPYRGEVKVSHLMIKMNENPALPEVSEAKRKADSIYSKLKNGANWNEMVKQYSDDNNTKATGGALDWISSLAKLPDAFKDAAFGLDDKGDISEPVLTQFGWHIIRKDDLRPLKPKAELLDKIRTQISRESERAKINEKALIDRIKREEGFEESTKNLKKFTKKLDSSIVKATYKADPKMKEKNLFRIGDRWFTTADFSKYIEQYQTAQPSGDIQTTANTMYTGFVNRNILQYRENNLEEKYDAFRYLMQEYHDGILLFNLTEKVVWNKAIEDTTGLQEYYEKHKHEHMWKERINVTIYESEDKKSYDMVVNLLKKDSSDAKISQTVNEKNPLSLVIKRSRYERGENAFIDSIEWKKGIQYFPKKDGKFVVVKVTEILPAGPKALNEIKGLMTGEYQNELEKQWINELRAKYPVTVREETLTTIF